MGALLSGEPSLRPRGRDTVAARSRCLPAGREHAGDPERELLIASIDELTPEDRRHVAALVESLRNRAAQEPTDG